MSANESFTLIVVPDRHAEVKRFHLRKIWVFQAIAAVAVVVLIGLVMAGHYVSVVAEASAVGASGSREAVAPEASSVAELAAVMLCSAHV